MDVFFGLRSENIRHDIGFIIAMLLAICFIIELVNIGEEEHTFCWCAFGIATHDAIKLPRNLEFFRNERVGRKDASTVKVAFKRSKTMTFGAMTKNVLA